MVLSGLTSPNFPMDQEEKSQQLKNAIVALEAQRTILGDLVVEASISALQKEIASLRPAYIEERKLVSILFCDIVGSTRIAADRDPEVVLTIVNGALQEMNQAIEFFGGTVSRYMGDGILAIFGAPKAQERHAEQAIRAGLAIQDRMAVYADQLRQEHDLPNFQARVGINSGHVVGGVVGGEHGEYTVIGDAANLASRFEAAAPPGAVLVGESTYHLAGGERILDTEALVPIAVKGSLKAQRVYLVKRLHAFPKLIGAAQAPLTGRSSEMTTLQESFQRINEQQTLAFIQVIGPAGIGKTRLRREFTAWLESSPIPHHLYLARALTFSGSTPYALASSLLKAAMNIVDTDTLEQRRENLLAGWQEIGSLSEEHLHGLAALTAVNLEKNSLDDLDPQARRDVIFESFITFWQRQAEQSLLVLVLEDTHWADELSLDLLEKLADALRNTGLLLIFISRPARRQEGRYLTLKSRLDKAFLSPIILKELDLGQTGRLVKGLLAFNEVPLDLIRGIDDKAQGNPFFIEEIVNSLLEDGSLMNQDGAWVLTKDMAAVQVPDTIQGVLATRIDRLEQDDKQILQYAAIIGRSFAQKVLAGLFEREIEGPLESLRERDFIVKSGRMALEDDWDWLFRHVLVQEVAYESVLIEIRRKTHYRIALNLESIAQDRVDELAPTMAHHFQYGQQWDRAIFYLVQAAEHAAQMFALQDALSFFDRAIDLGEAHPREIPPNTLLDIFEKRGDARALAYEFDSAEVDFRICLAEARRAGDRKREQSLLVRLGFLFRTADRLEDAVEYLQAGLEVARRSADRRAVADTLYHIGTVAWTDGDIVAALRYQEEAVDICQQLELQDLVAVQALHGLAEAQTWVGNPRQAVENFQKSIQLARQIGDKSYESENLFMMAYACLNDSGIADYDLGLESVEQALEISRKARLDGHTAPALFVAGAIYGAIGDYKKGFEYINEAIAWSENLGVVRFKTVAYYSLAGLYRDINLFEKALDAGARGLKIAVDNQIEFNLNGLRASVAIDRLHLRDLSVEQELLSTLGLAQENGQGIHVLRCLEGLAEWAAAVEDWPLLLHYCRKMEEIAADGGQWGSAARAGKFRAVAFIAMGEFQTAENELKRVVKIANKIRGVRFISDVHAAMEQLYRAWGKEAQADEEAAQVVAIVEQIRANLQDAELQIGLPGNEPARA